MTQKIQKQCNQSIFVEIHRVVCSIVPFDYKEKEHNIFVQKWIESGTEIFRIAKPATPDPHLVSYFLLVDQTENKVLLVDHIKARLWLPTGGHVELNEHPRETVKREIVEELGISADFLSEDPFFVTVSKTVGLTAGHTDVSLWYILKGCATVALQYNKEEFHQIRWFLPSEIPYLQSDPHMMRCNKKLVHFKILNES